MEFTSKKICTQIYFQLSSFAQQPSSVVLIRTKYHPSNIESVVALLLGYIFAVLLTVTDIKIMIGQTITYILPINYIDYIIVDFTSVYLLSISNLSKGHNPVRKIEVETISACEQHK